MCIRDRSGGLRRQEVAEAAGHLPVVAVFRVGGVEVRRVVAVSYTHLRAHETVLDLVCRLLLEKKKKQETETVCRRI